MTHNYFDDSHTGLSFLKCGRQLALVRGVLTPCREEYVIPAQVIDPDGQVRTVMGIDHEAFMDQTALQKVVAHQFLILIGHFAFRGCTSLKRFECLCFEDRCDIDGSDFTLGIDEPFRFYTLLSEAAFCGCTNLEYVKGDFTFKPEGKPQAVFQGCEALTQIDGRFMVDNIDASDSEHYYGIPPRCFKGCKSLREVTIDGICTVPIEEYVSSEVHFEAFAGCESLERINGSMHVQTIYRDAFKDCSRLQDHPYTHNFRIGSKNSLKL